MPWMICCWLIPFKAQIPQDRCSISISTNHSSTWFECAKPASGWLATWTVLSQYCVCPADGLPCVFVTFPCGILGQVWYLVVSIPHLCLSRPNLVLCKFPAAKLRGNYRNDFRLSISLSILNTFFSPLYLLKPLKQFIKLLQNAYTEMCKTYKSAMQTQGQGHSSRP